MSTPNVIPVTDHSGSGERAEVDPAGLMMAVTRAATEFMNASAPGAPPLQWTVADGDYGYRVFAYLSRSDRTVSDPAAVAAVWRDALGLEDEHRTAHTITIGGDFADEHTRLAVRICYQVDKPEPAPPIADGG